MTVSTPLGECLALLFEHKSITASNLKVVEDNARRPSPDLVNKAAASREIMGASCHCLVDLGESNDTLVSVGECSEYSSSFDDFDSEDDSRWDSCGSEDTPYRWDSSGAKHDKNNRIPNQKNILIGQETPVVLVAPARKLTPDMTKKDHRTCRGYPRGAAFHRKDKEEDKTRFHRNISLPSWLRQLPVEAKRDLRTATTA